MLYREPVHRIYISSNMTIKNSATANLRSSSCLVVYRSVLVLYFPYKLLMNILVKISNLQISNSRGGIYSKTMVK